jgi:hypothetical protein
VRAAKGSVFLGRPAWSLRDLADIGVALLTQRLARLRKK